MSEPRAASKAATLEYVAAIGGPHPHAKTVRFLFFAVVWLIGALHLGLDLMQS